MPGLWSEWILNGFFWSWTDTLDSIISKPLIFAPFIHVTVSPCESGIIELQPTQRMKRGLTLMCKIMQNIANHVLFTKEQHMRPFNDFLKTNFDAGRRYLLFNYWAKTLPRNLVLRSSILYITENITFFDFESTFPFITILLHVS